MSILAIDYGRKNLGLAITFDQKVVHLLDPLHYARRQDIFYQLAFLLNEHQIEKVVVGLPLNTQGEMGQMAKEAYQFGRELEHKLGKKVLFQNETLTSWQAQERAIAVGTPRQKRRQKEHSLAASLILQDFLAKMQGTD